MILAVYLSAAMEYLCAEVLELSGNACKDNKKKRIIPRHICLAVRNDEELAKLFDKVTIAAGGVLPNIHSVLLPKRTQRKDEGEGTPTKKKKVVKTEKSASQTKSSSKKPKASPSKSKKGSSSKESTQETLFEEE
jgi:histone H2A